MLTNEATDVLLEAIEESAHFRTSYDSTNNRDSGFSYCRLPIYHVSISYETPVVPHKDCNSAQITAVDREI